MDNLTKDWLSGVLKKYENRPQDSHRWAPVESVNEDGSYQVKLNGSSVSARCSRGCVAEPGDVVLVLITADGKCVAVSRLGGEIGGGGGGADTTAVVLYDNPAGTPDSFELSDSAANYSCIDVVAQYADRVQCGFTRIYDPDGKTVDLDASIPSSNLSVSRTRLTFSGKSVTQAYNEQWKESDASGTNDVLRVTMVVGYPTVPNEGLPEGGGVTVETDPTVPAWAKQPNPPTYTAEDVGALPAGTKIPSKTSDLTNDSGFIDSKSLSGYYTRAEVDEIVRQAINEVRGVPSDYTIINYIQSSGNQYINTGFTPNGSTGFSVDFTTSDSLGTDNYGCVFGARKGSGSSEFQVTTYTSNSSSLAGTFRYNDSNNNAGIAKGKRMTCSFLSNKYISSQGASYSVSSKSFNPGVPLTIFALNNNGTITQHGKVKLYGFKLYDAGTPVRDFVPVMNNANGTVGLYDVINGKFYKNAGSGSFTAG